MVCQLSGVQFPTFGFYSLPPYGPVPTPVLANDTTGWDFFAGDIGVFWDMGDGRVGILYGDCYGSEWRGGFDKDRGFVVTHKVRSGFPATSASDFDTGGPAFGGVIGVSSVGSWPDPQDDDLPAYISVKTGVGPGGWASLRYNVTNPGSGIAGSLGGATLTTGGGTITAGQDIASGDPRTNGGYRGTLLATSTTTDLGSGLTIDTMLAHPDGCAISPWPVTPTVSPPDTADWFPSTVSLPSGTYVAISAVKREAGYVTVTTSAPHGLPLTGSGYRPHGPRVYITGTTSKSSTVTAGTAPFATNSAAFLAGTGTVPVTSGFGFVGAAGSATQREFMLQHLGGWSRMRATDATTTQLTGVTYVGGTGSTPGLSYSGAGVVQGVDRSATKAFVDNEWTIHDVPTTTTFRVVHSFQPDRAGGIPTAVAHFPKVTPPADPVNDPCIGNFSVGACSVPNGAGRRQVSYNFRSYDTGHTALEVWHSTDGGDVNLWSRAATAVWDQDEMLQAPIQGIHPYTDEDDICGFGYPHVDLIAGPALIRGRVHVDDVLDKSSYEWWTGGDPLDTGNWSTDETDGQHLGWTHWAGFQPGSSYSCSLAYLPAQGVWACTYGEALAVQVRFSEDSFAWGDQRLVASANDWPGNGYFYGGWIHPYSGITPNDPSAIYIAITMISPYQVYLLKVPLVDPGGVDNTVEDQYNITRMRPGGTIAEWDSWLTDTNPWVRTGNHTFTIAADASGYLSPGTKVSYDDGAVEYGVVGSVAFGSGVTTVNLIPNTSYAMAAATIEGRRYSHAAAPPGFPSAFNYSPTITGYSSNPTDTVYQWAPEKPGWLTVMIREVTAGTKSASATSPTYSLPIACKNVTNGAWSGASSIRDNVTQANACSLIVAPAISTTVLTASDSYALTNTWSPSNPAQVAIGTVTYPYA